tara:strand:+ start:121595 stop:121969 length:375 start_codon:yes stop_codon:yes gene_type:complete
MNAQTTTYSAVLGVILASLRKEFGKEQNDIAQKMGLSQASYSRLESGKATFSVDQMYQASLALGVPDFDLMSRMNNMVGQLRRNGVEVQPHIRANATKGGTLEVDEMLLGAALAALLIGLLSRK